MNAELDAALAAIERRDWAGALEALLVEFGATRSVAIAELIGAVDARLPLDTPLKTIRGRPRFERVLAEGRATDVAFLVASAEATGCVALLDKRPPDPRIAFALAEHVARMAKRSPQTRKHYERVLAAIAAIRFPPTIEHLERARASATRLGVAAFRAWMVETLDATIAEIASWPPAIDDEPRLAELRAALARDSVARARAGRTIDDLEAEVYANPDDLGPRHVLADALVQVGDVRGELIALQLLPELDRKQKARCNAIIRDHRARLLGPLADRVLADELVFERGFPARGRIRRPMVVTDTFPQVPHWSTFTSLAAPDIEAMQEVPLRWLREVHEVTEVLLDRLATLDHPTRLEVISFTYISPAMVDRVRSLMASVLPALRSVRWNASWAAAYGIRDEELCEAVQALPVEHVEIVTGWNVVVSPVLRCATATRQVVVAYRDARIIARDRELVFELNEVRRDFGVDEVLRVVREMAEHFGAIVLPRNAFGDRVEPLATALGVTVRRAGA